MWFRKAYSPVIVRSAKRPDWMAAAVLICCAGCGGATTSSDYQLNQAQHLNG